MLTLTHLHSHLRLEVLFNFTLSYLRYHSSFFSDDDVTEVEDHVPIDVSMPLMRVHRCDQDGSSIELSVHTGIIPPSNLNNNDNSSNNCDIRLKLLSLSETTVGMSMSTSNPYHRPQELATLLGEHLHSALRLHLWSTYRPISGVISLV